MKIESKYINLNSNMIILKGYQIKVFKGFITEFKFQYDNT